MVQRQIIQTYKRLIFKLRWVAQSLPPHIFKSVDHSLCRRRRVVGIVRFLCRAALFLGSGRCRGRSALSTRRCDRRDRCSSHHHHRLRRRRHGIIVIVLWMIEFQKMLGIDPGNQLQKKKRKVCVNITYSIVYTNT